MNNYWAFAPMTDSSDLLGDPEALKARMDEQGYLYFQQLVDEVRIGALRREMLAVLAEHRWIAGGDQRDRGRVVGPAVREGDDEFFEAYDAIQKLESFHTLAHDDALMTAMRAVLGDTAFPHPLKVARLMFPSEPMVTTPPHQDSLNNQGTPSLTAAWMPVGAARCGAAPWRSFAGQIASAFFRSNSTSDQAIAKPLVPPEMHEQLTWVTTDMCAGDVLLFGALTVHASLHNTTREIRLSVDFRYQREGEELTDLVLEPHFGRFSWDEIYAGWATEEHQYYWRNLDYRMVRFDRGPFEESEPTEKEIGTVALYERARERRRRRLRNATSADPGENRSRPPTGG